MHRNPVAKLLLFGATGDLAQRMLLPSLYGLHADGLLPDGLTITGTARHEHDDDGLPQVRQGGARRVPARGSQGRERDRDASSTRLFYQALDADRPGAFQAAGGQGRRHLRRARDLPVDRAVAVRADDRGAATRPGLPATTVRIGLEKPLGYDLASSREINDAVAAAFPEDRTFRIDHYLGKETVQNILALRFGNSFFEPVWNAQGIDNVQITISETVGLEDRAGYYDGAGALRDMVANHMLQLLALIAMEPPARFDGTAIRDEKVKVFRSLRTIKPEEVPHVTVTGQYGEGAVDGRDRQGLCRRTRQAVDHRDLRRDQGACRQLALAGRAVLPAHRQAHGRRGAARSRSSSSRCRIRCSPGAAGCSSPTC